MKLSFTFSIMSQLYRESGWRSLFAGKDHNENYSNTIKPSLHNRPDIWDYHSRTHRVRSKCVVRYKHFLVAWCSALGWLSLKLPQVLIYPELCLSQLRGFRFCAQQSWSLNRLSSLIFTTSDMRFSNSSSFIILILVTTAWADQVKRTNVFVMLASVPVKIFLTTHAFR